MQGYNIFLKAKYGLIERDYWLYGVKLLIATKRHKLSNFRRSVRSKISAAVSKTYSEIRRNVVEISLYLLDDVCWMTRVAESSMFLICGANLLPSPHISCEQAHHQAPSRNVAASENRAFLGGELNGGDGGF
jgi:hypothetical protein